LVTGPGKELSVSLSGGIARRLAETLVEMVAGDIVDQEGLAKKEQSNETEDQHGMWLIECLAAVAVATPARMGDRRLGQASLYRMATESAEAQREELRSWALRMVVSIQH